jgi:hypothetical protein
MLRAQRSLPGIARSDSDERSRTATRACSVRIRQSLRASPPLWGAPNWASMQPCGGFITSTPAPASSTGTSSSGCMLRVHAHSATVRLRFSQVAASAATAAAAATPAIRRPPGFIPGDYQYCNRATLLIFPSEPLCCVCCMHTNGKRRPSASASTARCCPRPAPA